MNRKWTVLKFSLAALLLALVVSGCALVEDGDNPVDGSAGENENAGTLIVAVEADPAGQAGSFLFTGVPSGTISADGTLVVTDLDPGTYTVTEADPAPDFDVTAVRCDDGDSTLSSSGDPGTRTAIFNLDPSETVRCTFTNTQRGSVVVASRTVPDGETGSFLFTGVPSGTIPANGTLVVANLPPGTYTTTEADPAPDFDLTAVGCDDGASATPSGGDPQTRSAIFQVDPGEMVLCTFTNTRRGTAIVVAEISSEESTGSFWYTGVPSGTISGGGTLAVTNLAPGTYTSTEVDRDSDFELVEVTCDDGAGPTPSSGDVSTGNSIFNIDAGETVRCVYRYEFDPSDVGGGPGTGSPDGGGGGGGEGTSNPFDDPDSDLSDFPLTDDLPPDAGTYAAPKAGPWTVNNLAGSVDCGATSLSIPTSPPETGTIEVLDGGQTLVGSSLQEGEAPVTMSVDPEITGRYTGTVDGMEQGVPIVINFVWQVVTDEYVVGYLTSSFTEEGVTCSIYRPYVLTYAGE